MPVKQSSFSSHLITTVISQSFILLFDKGTKEKAREMGRNLSLAGNREEKVRASKARGTRKREDGDKAWGGGKNMGVVCHSPLQGSVFRQNFPAWPVPYMAWHIALLRAGGEGGDREWDGRIASPTQWTRVWVNCWETVKNREAWRAAVPGITKTRTQLSDWTTTCYLECRNMLAVWPYHFKLKIHVAFDIIVLFLWIYSYTHIHVYRKPSLNHLIHDFFSFGFLTVKYRRVWVHSAT